MDRHAGRFFARRQGGAIVAKDSVPAPVKVSGTVRGGIPSLPRFACAGRVKRIDRLDRKIARLERDLGIGVEMIAQFVRFWLTSTPPPPETERAALRRLGGDRYDAFIEALGRRLANGPRVRQEIGEDVSVPRESLNIDETPAETS